MKKNLVFIRQFEQKVKNTILKYKLAGKKDKIVVACSGGKDSTTTLYLLKKFKYNAEALIIDLYLGNWSKENLENIRKFCKNNKIKIHIIDIRKEFGCGICYIRSNIQSKAKLTNCLICGVIKRWLINKKARVLGATKLATGHNLDDEAETVLMNLFKGNPELSINLGVKTGIISDKKFIQRIKPLYFLSNKEIKKYAETMKFPILYQPCPCGTGTFRREIRKWLTKLEENNPEIRIKQKIVENFQKLLPIIQKKYHAEGKLKYCAICQEPSRNEICKRCELIGILKR